MRVVRPSPSQAVVLYLSVILIATCGLIYELLAGTLASYLLGDSITQFSLVIGLYLSAMGVGAWLSRFVVRQLARVFVEVELGVALLGGISAPMLFLSFSYLKAFSVFLYGTVFAIGVLVGLELPLLMRILKDNLDFKELVARVLSLDYLGALVASLLFPILLVPKLGLVRTSLLFGMLNALVGLWSTWLLRSVLPGNVAGLRGRAAIVIFLLAAGLIKAETLTSLAEDRLFTGEIVYSKTSLYQRIIITRDKIGFQLFLNGNLQMSSFDEYRYHEALVHPAMASFGAPRRVLILGGGDGLGLREVLRYPSVEEVVLVDLDPDMTNLSKEFPPLAELNEHAFEDRRVKVVNQDAMIWLEEAKEPFDVVLIDFPDPNNFSLGKLYTTRFYHLLKQHLHPTSAVAIQATSPLLAPKAYWCVVTTMEAAGFSVHPYQVSVPTFGIWGYALARLSPFEPPTHIPLSLKFLDDKMLASLFVFPRDMARVPTEVNRLDNQILVRYYESEWRRWE